MWDPVAKRIVRPKEGKDTWTPAELAKGVPVTIPPQTRVLLTLTVKDPRK